jgi:hypothetical protein
MASSPPLAEVAVDVRANLDQLDRDLAAGKKQTEAWANAVQKSVGGPARNVQTAMAGATKATNAQTVAVKGAVVANDQMVAAAERYFQKASVRLAAINAEGKAHQTAAGAIKAHTTAISEQDRATAQANARALKAAGDAGTRWANAIRSPIIEILGYVTAQKLLEIGTDALKSAGELEGLSKQLGVSTTDLQVYRFAATQLGIDQSDLDTGLRRLTERIGQAATGSKEATKAFQLVGFSVKELRDGSIDAGKALPRIADFLSRIPNPAQRAAVEVEMFGIAGQKLDPLLTQGAGGIDNLRAAAERLGVVLSEREIQEADETAKKLAAVKQVLEANVARTVAENASAIISLADALGHLTARIIQFMAANPAEAMAILGALTGARIGGLAGAVMGAGAGYVAGTAIAQNARHASADANMDLGFRRRMLDQAKADRDAMQGHRVAGESSYLFGLVKTRRVDPNARTGGTAAGANAEYARQLSLYRQAGQAAKAGPSAPPPLDPALQRQLDALNAPAGRKGPRGPSAETLARRAEAARLKAVRDQEAYDRDIGRLEQEYKDAQADLTGDHTERAKLEKEKLDREQADFDKDADAKGPSGTKQYSAVQVEALKAAEAKLISAKKELADQKESEAIAADALALNRAIGEREEEMLRAREALTTSADERRKIELRILEIEKGIEKQELETEIAAEHDPIKKRVLESKRAGLDARYEAKTNEMNRSALDARIGTAPDGTAHGYDDQIAGAAKDRDDRIGTVRAAAQAEIELTHANEEERLRILQDAADREVEIRADADKKITDLETAKRTMLLSTAQDIAENLASIAEGIAGKQSAVYRGIFATAKAFAIAQASIAMYQNIAEAMRWGFPQNLPFIAAAVAQGAAIMADISAISGSFDVGGWTGGRAGAPAGIVHGEEFVVRAGPAAANRAALEAINAGRNPSFAMMGAARSGGLMGSGDRPLNVHLQNFAPGVRHEIQRGLTRDDVVIIAREEAPKAIAADLERPNSRTRKSLARNTTTKGRTR